MRISKELEDALDKVFVNKDKLQKQRGLYLNAKLQAKVWRNQMKGKHKDTIAKELLKKLNAKYPELPAGDLRFIAIQVI